jgi:hypothetical protein
LGRRKAVRVVPTYRGSEFSDTELEIIMPLLGEDCKQFFGLMKSSDIPFLNIVKDDGIIFRFAIHNT